MKYAVMSDVHSNPAALKVALADAKELGCERFVLLGDITGYGYDVKTALNLARRSFQVVLQGNHDSACIGNEPDWKLELIRNYDIDVAQREVLSARAKGWLKGLPHLHVESGAAFAHDNFTRPGSWGYVIDASEAMASFRGQPEPLLFCGHTHVAGAWEKTSGGKIRIARQFKNPAAAPELTELELAPGSRYIVNVGSVGYPRNDLCSTYCIWEPDEKRVSFRRLPFDFKDYIEKMLDAKVGLPDWLLDLLMRVR